MSIEETLARGTTTFMGLELAVERDVLVPREETELLGNTVLGLLQGIAEPRVIDMCCGAGNISCAIAAHVPSARVWASDLSGAAAALTAKNAEKLGLSARVSASAGDLFERLADKGLHGSVDVVACNPPYISQGKLETASHFLLEHEPRAAFDGGPYGLSIHTRVMKECLPFLRPGGFLVFEVGVGQARQVTILFNRAKVYREVRAVPNSAGEDRVVLGRMIEAP